MKNTAIISGVIMMSSLMFSCKDNTAFTVSGTVKNPSKIKEVYLLQADSTAQFRVVDSAILSGSGDYRFKRSAKSVNLYKLKADTTHFTLVAQNGDAIELATDLADSRHDYTVSGSDASSKIKTFDEFTKAYTERNNKVIAEFQQQSQKAGEQPDSLLKIFMPAFQKNLADYSNAVLKFIDDNKGSLAGFYASTALDAVKYEQQLVAYADRIKRNPELARNPAVQSFIKLMEKAKPLSVGHQAPDFTITGADGNPVKLSDYKGKYVMVDFWASWCVPCRQENPNVLKQYQKFHAKGFNVLGVSLDKDKSAWQKAVSDDHLEWTQASDLKSFEGSTEQLYQIQAIPSNFIIDPQGKIAAKNVRGNDLEAFLTKAIH
ncbi:TlpA disulfide reductase family protein [Mucilaginibacter jinjuensis]|uniref:TlpA disulfide reductase family protein n=1 Tax=Mucilaginibacter jinjuensis TaxID=1176721 RepID=A0ABY7TD67_9SPHI|nr:TlpA disulfide reductase family protein [Mucilaginibacter jinjuensis]WCT14276.1 TlpA disulfide reductase family protein [Mucilaginibacter jinjuensis]